MRIHLIISSAVILSALTCRGQETPVSGETLGVAQLSAIHFGNGSPADMWLPHRVTLEPAQWIWLPSERTLPNTFVLFRKEVELAEKPVRATGWLTADSRYRLTINGHRVQWGPAPCDPRQLDVDPLDATALLQPGKNVIGVEVLYYGIGEGTWAAGKPGLLFHLVVDNAQGESLRIVSDTSWQCLIDRAHPPAQPKRWFLRALQEEFDARQRPEGWDTPEFVPDERWIAPMALDCPPDKPPSCSSYSTTDSLDRAASAASALRARQIPLVREVDVPAKQMADSGVVHWKRDPGRTADTLVLEAGCGARGRASAWLRGAARATPGKMGVCAQ